MASEWPLGWLIVENVLGDEDVAVHDAADQV